MDVKPRTNAEGTRWREQCVEGSPQRGRLGQRQNVTWADQSAIGKRAAATNRAAVDHRHLPTIAAEISGGCQANESAADDDYRAPRRIAHLSIPMQNGSRGSRIKFASALTCAEPV